MAGRPLVTNPQTIAPPADSARRLLGKSCIALLLLALGACWYLRTDSAEVVIRNGRKALRLQQYGKARRLAHELLARQPRSVSALLLAAEAEIGSGQFAQALALLDRIPDDTSEEACAARVAAAHLFLDEQRDLESAERQFRRAVQLCPDSAPANEGLAFVLGLQSRQWEAIPCRLRLLRSVGQETTAEARLQVLLSLALGDTALENPELIAQFQSAAPDSAGVQLALARIAFELKDYAESDRLLTQIVEATPESIEAQARWGRVLAELDDRERFEVWSRSLPAVAEDHPGVWYARSLRAQRDELPQVALRCLWELVRRDPNHQPACYQLGQLLAAEEKRKEAALFLDRARRLEAYVKTAELAFRIQDHERCLNAARQAESLGLLWEASSWAHAARFLGEDARPSDALIARLQPRLAGLPLVRTAEDSEPAGQVDLSALPLSGVFAGTFRSAGGAAPVGSGGFHAADKSTPATPSAQAAPTPAIRFEDLAASAGLDFKYRNGGDPQTGIVRMYEVVGGGVGVLDFDRDGAPDLYLPQGSDWPPDPSQREYLDQLFRNLDGVAFANVTASAGIVEPGFSQGAAVGDIDNDGFPDLLVGNIGGNRVFLNNGDGTFRDAAGGVPAGDRYTSSALIADLNQDSLPDLVALNYLEGDDLFHRVCGDSAGRVGSCLPQLFDAARSQLFLNRGDGGFDDVSSESGISGAAGKGLGIVAFDLDGSGALALFVANDVGPDFLWINRAEAGRTPRFVEQGLAAGVAMNRNGQFESGMGVAAGDADGDGRLDLFVTNFEEETNTLFRQIQPGQFVDATPAARLDRKREPYVGWGAQFLDADLDGLPDLLFANGHINNLEHQHKPYRMPAQFFHNSGAARFDEWPAQTLGPYFETAHLGRGLARLDWNGDGRDDALVTHLDAPPALLTNRTEPHGHFAAFELHGIRSSRDAIGASLSIVASGRTITRHLTAGDGNQVSNQRRMTVGLGAAETIDELTVHWPSGERQTFRDLPANRLFICVEGRAPLSQP